MFEKYVVSTRSDGVFVVNEIRSGVVVSEGVEKELSVCKNCLNALRWRGYRAGSGLDRIWESFDLDEFFQEYRSTIANRPRDTDQSSPENTYSADWDGISNSYKGSVGWICEECSINLSNPNGRKFLWVHHINGRKNDNSESNLEALCFECHSSKPNHSHMRSLPMYNEFRVYRIFDRFSSE